MSNRKLLEDAAKAAGVDAWWAKPYQHMLIRSDGNRKWCPLSNDGDALRLFAKMPFCELFVSEIGCTVFLPRKTPSEGPSYKFDEFSSEHNGDIHAAIRHAITRAAAFIGEKMP